MRIEPTLDEVVNGRRGILAGVTLCLDAQCLVSALALIFSGIDALAALTRPVTRNNTDRGVFIAWVERYMLPQSELGCSAADLYGARCGVVHNYAPESQMQRNGQARRLIYQWRTGPRADEAVPLPPDALIIEVEHLHRAFENAVHLFLIDTEMDALVHERVMHHLPTLLCYRPFPVVEVRQAS